jgi:hypothetical protein
MPEDRSLTGAGEVLGNQKNQPFPSFCSKSRFQTEAVQLGL